MTKHIKQTGRMTMTARKIASPAHAGRTPPPQPNYNDELSSEQHAAIRRLTDPQGDRHCGRTLLHAPAW
jgi:hypothetical protein